jgi:hypothetical protein
MYYTVGTKQISNLFLIIKAAVAYETATQRAVGLCLEKLVSASNPSTCKIYFCTDLYDEAKQRNSPS